MPPIRNLLLVFYAASLGPCAVAAMDYPKIQLENSELQVSVYLPDAERGYYRGTRFDWSGIIERVQYRGHSFYAPLHAVHDPLKHDSLGGPADEFAMFNPMGFAEAGPGEPFVKIGVGLLQKKQSDEYVFHEDYKLLRAGEWRVEHGPDRILFEQELDGERGWSYRYRKRIRLLAGKSEFEIEYHLENSGEKTIDITHYNHNFTIIDDLPFGPGYRVELPFIPGQTVAANDLARLHGNVIELDQPLGKDSIWIQLYDGEARSDYNAATVLNTRSGAAVSFKGDAPITRMVFWAVERAASPEPFIRLLLQPGEVAEWSSRYRFIADEP